MISSRSILSWATLFLLLSTILLGPISYLSKYVFFAIFFYSVLLLPRIFFQEVWSKGLLKEVSLLFIVNMIWVLLIPLFYGRVKMAFAEGDCFFWLALVVMLMYLNIKILHKISILVLCVFVFSIGLLVFWKEFQALPHMITGVHLMKELYNGSIFVGPASPAEGDWFFRVFFINLLWIPVLLFFLRTVLQERWLRIIVASLYLFVCIIGYSRGVWLMIAIALFAVLFFDFKEWKKQGTIILAGLAVAIVLVVATTTTTTTALDSVKMRTESLVQMDNQSNLSRLQQVPILLEEWKKAPVFGFGYGHAAKDLVRDEEAPFSYEMVPVALLMKLGVVGVLLNIVLLFRIFRHISQKTKGAKLRAACISSYIFILLVSMTNPYLFNFIGMAIFSFILLLSYESYQDD